jgi:hypothetical protein
MSRHDRFRAFLLAARIWLIVAAGALLIVAWEVLWYAPPWWTR